MNKYSFIVFMLVSCLLSTSAFADSNQGITLSDLPALVKTSAQEHFLPKDIKQVKLINDKTATLYQVSGDIDDIQTSMIFNASGFVTSITQTFQQEKQINCTDVKLPVLSEDEQYYFQVEGVIQAKPVVHCKPGRAE